MSPEQTSTPVTDQPDAAEKPDETPPTAKTFDAASIYPTAVEYTDSDGKPAPAPASSATNALTSFDANSSRDGMYSLIGGISSVLVGVVIIFAGNVFNFGGGEVGFILQLLFIGSLSGAGLFFGYLAQKNKRDDAALGAVGMALGAVMFVIVIFMSSYYIKLRIEINKFKTQFRTHQTIKSDSTIDS